MIGPILLVAPSRAAASVAVVALVAACSISPRRDAIAEPGRVVRCRPWRRRRRRPPAAPTARRPARQPLAGGEKQAVTIDTAEGPDRDQASRPTWGRSRPATSSPSPSAASTTASSSTGSCRASSSRAATRPGTGGGGGRATDRGRPGDGDLQARRRGDGRTPGRTRRGRSSSSSSTTSPRGARLGRHVLDLRPRDLRHGGRRRDRRDAERRRSTNAAIEPDRDGQGHRQPRSATRRRSP